jgi:hypothetical protein
MSRKKRTVIAISLALMIVVSPTSKGQAGGIPVIDTANLVQSIRTHWRCQRSMVPRKTSDTFFVWAWITRESSVMTSTRKAARF